MAEETPLFCTYIDDDNMLQGPYQVDKVLHWFANDCFQDYHVMRFTDNGMKIGNRVTYETTVGVLKRKFGKEIPTTVQMLNRAGIYGFNVKVEMRQSAVQPIKLKAFDEDDEDVKSRHKDSPKENKTIRKTRTISSSSSVKSDYHPYSRKKGSDEKKKDKKSRAYRPFYDGSTSNQNDWLHKVVAVEFARLLKKRYDAMGSFQRHELHSHCRAMWKVPAKCKACECTLGQPSNFLTHVLSESHINKRMDTRKVTFSYEYDYVELKVLFAVHDSQSTPWSSPWSESSDSPERRPLNKVEGNSDTKS